MIKSGCLPCRAKEFPPLLQPSSQQQQKKMSVTSHATHSLSPSSVLRSTAKPVEEEIVLPGGPTRTSDEDGGATDHEVHSTRTTETLALFKIQVFPLSTPSSEVSLTAAAAAGCYLRNSEKGHGGPRRTLFLLSRQSVPSTLFMTQSPFFQECHNREAGGQ